MKIKEFLLQNKKLVLGLGVAALIIVFILVLVGMNSEKRNLMDSPIRQIDMQIFYSKSSRDEEKKEQYSFNLGDPIQASVIFEDVYKDTPITLEVKDAKGKIVQNTEFQIGGTEDTFVTINSATEKGQYDVVVKYEGKQISSSSFRVN